MSSPRAVIAEDEANLREQLRETLKSLWPELRIVAEAEDGLQAMRALDRHAPEILFLDIQMPGMTGLEVAKQASGRAHVVFVTAFDEHAVAAFEQGAVDYVMKPFSPARLAETIKRLRERLQTRPANLDRLLETLGTKAAAGRPHLRWITASQGDELRLITMEEILYFKSDNKYTLVVTSEQESLVRQPIKDLIEQLDPETFWQVHRGTVVNVHCIAGVGRTLSGQLELRLKARQERLAVSESYAHRFRQL